MPKPGSSIQPVVVLDSENRRLASGRAQFLFGEKKGHFWLHDILKPADRDNFLKSAAILQTLDGQLTKIQNFRLCSCLVDVHFHFDFQFLPP